MVNKYIFKKESLIFLSLIFTNFGCEIKRDAIGADNEIIVICSDMLIKIMLKVSYIDFQ